MTDVLAPSPAGVQSERLRRLRTAASSPLALVAIAALVVLVKYGVGLHPEWARLQQVASVWPNPTRAPLMMQTDGSLLSNITQPWLLGAVGARTPLLYLLGSLALAVLAVVTPMLMPAIRASMTARRLAFLMIVGGPIPAVLLGWIGGYDAVLVIFMSVAVLSRSTWLGAFGWFALAFSHAALGFVAFLFWVPMALVTTPSSSRSAAVRRVFVSAAAGGLGWLMIRALTDLWGGSADRWSLFRAIAIDDIASAYLANLPLVAFSVLGIGWLVLLSRPVRSALPTRVLIAEGLVAAFVVPLIAVDHTRIASLALFAAVLSWLAASPAFVPTSAASKVSRVLVIPAVVLPIVVIWMGAPLTHPWPGVAEFLQAAR